MELIKNIFLEARIASEEERAVVALALEGVASRKGTGFRTLETLESWKRREDMVDMLGDGASETRVLGRGQIIGQRTKVKRKGRRRGGQRNGEMKRRGGGRGRRGGWSGGWLNERGGGSALGRVLRGTRERVGE